VIFHNQNWTFETHQFLIWFTLLTTLSAKKRRLDRRHFESSILRKLEKIEKQSRIEKDDDWPSAADLTWVKRFWGLIESCEGSALSYQRLPLSSILLFLRRTLFSLSHTMKRRRIKKQEAILIAIYLPSMEVLFWLWCNFVCLVI
jgi:hypothetical protein